MAEQWKEEQHLDDLLDVVQRVPELAVNARMSQGERVKKCRKGQTSLWWKIRKR